MAEVMEKGNFIGGQWQGSRSGATEEILAPATGEVIGTVPASDEKDVDDAVSDASKAGRKAVLVQVTRDDANRFVALPIAG